MYLNSKKENLTPGLRNLCPKAHLLAQRVTSDVRRSGAPPVTHVQRQNGSGAAGLSRSNVPIYIMQKPSISLCVWFNNMKIVDRGQDGKVLNMFWTVIVVALMAGKSPCVFCFFPLTGWARFREKVPDTAPCCDLLSQFLQRFSVVRNDFIATKKTC